MVFVDPFMVDDADIVIVAMGSSARTIRSVVKNREKGIKVGLVRIRSFRPFPHKDLRELLSESKLVAVMDKGIRPGQYSALYLDVSRCNCYTIS